MDPFLSPFAPDSIWNRPVGQSAALAPSGIPAPSNFNTDRVLLLRESASYPVWTLYTNNQSWPATTRPDNPQPYGPVPPSQLRLPASFSLPNPGGNSLVSVLSLDASRWYHFGVVAVDTAARKFYTNTRSPQSTSTGTPVTGDGALGMHGGSGLSAVGGLIRPGELTNGILHAVQLNVWAKFLSISTGGYRWPAVTADSYAQGSYTGSNPDVKQGSLLVIPQGVTAASLGITSTSGKNLFSALQTYGAYIVDDSAWDDIDISVDSTVTEALPSLAEFRKMVTALQVVKNNLSGPTAGGGAPVASYSGFTPTPTPTPTPTDTVHSVEFRTTLTTEYRVDGGAWKAYTGTISV